ncbi:amylo-alpha-1,6-glucosidase [Frateuria defendens]|uniref:amylo-alpha-1,6-glucosidase n=1 Tax=Frateuria defendens TaxID=2219559 RepID=UPI00066FD6DF|nr:amylo-alpha-1,6-glucosidase [Frateuria defendens]
MAHEAPSLPDTEPPPRSLQSLFVLKEGDSFLVADAFGDVTGEDDGLFHNDTRLLSGFHLYLAGRRPSLLSSAVSQDNLYFTANLTNHPLPSLGDSPIPQAVVHVERKRFLWEDRVYERVRLVNYSDQPTRVPLMLRFAADFRDMFEVRGQRRLQRGQAQSAEVDGRGVELRYHGLDGRLRRMAIDFSEPPQQLDEWHAEFQVALAPRAEWRLYLEVGPARAEPCRARYRQCAARAWRSLRLRRHRGARPVASGRLFQAWLDKSRADLALLTTELPTGPYPYAGIPWFSTPFGRDAIITSLQVLWLDPSLARGVLAFLAQNQARETSAFRDAQPGKIMHETRKGEMAAANELPFAQYYGGVDTTPLFLMLAGAYARRTGDMTLVGQLWPALVAATHWLENNADASPYGLLTYARGELSGLANQGWKDSHDSVFHADGRPAEGPIALIEVQGYAYRAYRDMAELAERREETNAALHWRRRADQLRKTVEQRFWMDDLRYYALALDGAGEPCRIRGSNPGHLLYAGLPRPDRARAVTRQLLSRPLNSGWGIRTLATGTARFNPMSYHNGSVWPHDVALCAAGLARYGERDGVVRLLGNMFEAATQFGMRLPELFCGFDRAPGEAPIAYPVACLPQAWASGSAFMLLQACLGLYVDGRRGRLTIERPRLPRDIEQLTLRDLQVGVQRIDLAFRRLGDQVSVFIERQQGPREAKVDVRL